jgi:hypothetical protein
MRVAWIPASSRVTARQCPSASECGGDLVNLSSTRQPAKTRDHGVSDGEATSSSTATRRSAMASQV